LDFTLQLDASTEARLTFLLGTDCLEPLLSPVLMVDLTLEDIDVLLTWLEFSKDRMRSAPDLPSDVRLANIQSIEQVSQKLRGAKREMTRTQ
jgi:hypothetical protein